MNKNNALATEKSPSITVKNGIDMPALGLGVFLVLSEQTADVVETAIARSYWPWPVAATAQTWRNDDYDD
jgi:hypothetical protein